MKLSEILCETLLQHLREAEDPFLDTEILRGLIAGRGDTPTFEEVYHHLLVLRDRQLVAEEPPRKWRLTSQGHAVVESYQKL